MQLPFPGTVVYEDSKMIGIALATLVGFLFLILMSVLYLAYRLDKIGKDIKTIRALTAVDLQAETPEARRMAASIHTASDEG